MTIEEINQKVIEKSQIIDNVINEVGKVIVGQNYMIKRLFIGLLADGLQAGRAIDMGYRRNSGSCHFQLIQPGKLLLSGRHLFLKFFPQLILPTHF